VRGEEHSEQVALFAWSSWESKRVPELALLFAIPMGGYRPTNVAKQLKAEGARAGIPDVFLPVPRGCWHGIFIELKTPSGKVSPAQKGWLSALNEQGYVARVCRGWTEARELIIDYLAGKIT
jgi:hypothetical protein